MSLLTAKKLAQEIGLAYHVALDRIERYEKEVGPLPSVGEGRKRRFFPGAVEKLRDWLPTIEVRRGPKGKAPEPEEITDQQRRAIRLFLERRGIDADEIEEATWSLDPDWRSVLGELTAALNEVETEIEAILLAVADSPGPREDRKGKGREIGSRPDTECKLNSET